MSVNGSIFDALGLVAHVALRGRLLQWKFVWFVHVLLPSKIERMTGMTLFPWAPAGRGKEGALAPPWNFKIIIFFYKCNMYYL